MTKPMHPVYALTTYELRGNVAGAHEDDSVSGEILCPGGAARRS
jgi:hypothetical protein